MSYQWSPWIIYNFKSYDFCQKWRRSFIFFDLYFSIFLKLINKLIKHMHNLYIKHKDISLSFTILISLSFTQSPGDCGMGPLIIYVRSRNWAHWILTWIVVGLPKLASLLYITEATAIFEFEFYFYRLILKTYKLKPILLHYSSTTVKQGNFFF